MAHMTACRLSALVAAIVSVLALVATGCGDGTGAAASSVTLLAPTEAQALIESGEVEVIDVRTPQEYSEGHIEGATLVDFYEPDFADRIAELDRGDEYVVYCRSGNRSSQATALMADVGFADVNDVDGGIVAWEAAGLPVVR